MKKIHDNNSNNNNNDYNNDNDSCNSNMSQLFLHDINNINYL